MYNRILRKAYGKGGISIADTIIFRVFLIFFFGIGAFFDWKERKVPNWWVLSGLAAGIFFRKQYFFLPAIAVILLFFPLFLCRMIGAGDIKAMAVLVGFTGFGCGAVCLMAGFLIGGIFSLCKLLYKRELVRRLAYFGAYIQRLIRTRQIVPYYLPDRDGYGAAVPLTVCLFAGLCIGMLLTGR